HYRVDHPQRNDADWFCHAHLKKDDAGRMSSFKRAVEPYIVPIDSQERTAYDRLRVAATPQPALA
ncbi:fumarate reductase/succinate dehydrogenase flavoprotein subunit, partial [Klebsiella pneumoniae]|nr:fumarate reductase/succinate dehydrogenase flavoprotein subunit [Klebsiella pneumoniae]